MPDDAQRAAFEGAVAAAMAREPAIVAGWMFGSRARGTERASSDLDVAVLLGPGASTDVVSRLNAALAIALGIEVDVVDLAASTPVLGFEIVTGGRRVFARDAVAADDAEERCLREYLDTDYMRRVQHHYLYGDPL